MQHWDLWIMILTQAAGVTGMGSGIGSVGSTAQFVLLIAVEPAAPAVIHAWLQLSVLQHWRHLEIFRLFSASHWALTNIIIGSLIFETYIIGSQRLVEK